MKKSLQFILYMKNWEVFLLLLLGLLLQRNSIESQHVLGTLLSSTGNIMIVGWVVMAGHALSPYSHERSHMPYRIFTVCSLLWLVMAVVHPWLINVPGSPLFHIRWPLLIPLFACAVYTIYFTSTRVHAIEFQGSPNGLNASGIMLLIFLLAIGI